MTRKDYIKFARMMHNTMPDQYDCISSSIMTAQWKETMSAMCELFKEDNPKFNEQKFIDACVEGI